MRTRSDSEIPSPPDPFPQIPGWRYRPEFDGVTLPPPKRGPSGPEIRPVPEIPWPYHPPINAPTPFPAPGILPPGPAPSVPPIVPDRPPYEPPPSNSPNPFEPQKGAPPTPPPLSPERLDRIPQSENFYSPGQPAPAVQNLTAHVLRMKGVPEAVIGAAINDPAQMQGLLNQLYGRRSMVAPDAGGGIGSKIGAETSEDQPGQASTPAATPDSYPPFGWAGLPALRR